jgi:cell division protein FtsB
VRLLRACAAFGATAVALGLLALIVLQCAHLIQRNVALSRELVVVRGEVSDLEHKRAEQERTIRRLHDPSGAVPEIHERLRLVRPNEIMIFVKGVRVTPAPIP